jgi:thiamine pyrophosphokinase
MHIIIFAGGTLQQGVAVERALAGSELVIAADSGARTALSLGYTPALVVGDLDSLPQEILQEAERLGSQFVRAPVEKNETDTELAIQEALKRGASHVTILGALGGERFEHSIANILLLAGFASIPIDIVDGQTRGWLLQGPGETLIEGKSGDLLSLLPLTSSAEDVRTEQLYYPLRGETLHFGRPRGISNVLLAEHARVSLGRGLLLLVHTAV